MRDGQRFDELTRPLVGRLLRSARRILACEDLAWDAVQEALLSFWQQEFIPVEPEAWLIRAVTFRSLHLARTIRRCRWHEFNVCRERSEASLRDEPSHSATVLENTALLLLALEGLSESHRDVLELLLIEELDYQGIADVLGVPIGTVRSRLNRSRKALQKQLEQEHPEITKEKG